MDVDQTEIIQTADRTEQRTDRNVLDLNLEDPVVSCIRQIKDFFLGGGNNRVIYAGDGEAGAWVTQLQETDRLILTGAFYKNQLAVSLAGEDKVSSRRQFQRIGVGVADGLV